MKVYFSKDEAKIVQNSLYLSLGKLEQQIKNDPTSAAIDVYEEGVATHRKLLSYLNEKIEKEES